MLKTKLFNEEELWATTQNRVRGLTGKVLCGLWTQSPSLWGRSWQGSSHKCHFAIRLSLAPTMPRRACEHSGSQTEPAGRTCTPAAVRLPGCSQSPGRGVSSLLCTWKRCEHSPCPQERHQGCGWLGWPLSGSGLYPAGPQAGRPLAPLLGTGPAAGGRPPGLLLLYQEDPGRSSLLGPRKSHVSDGQRPQEDSKPLCMVSSGHLLPREQGQGGS